MKLKDAIKEMCYRDGISMTYMAKEMIHWKSTSTIARIIHNNSCTVDTLIDMCEALEYEIHLVNVARTEMGMESSIRLDRGDDRD